MCAGRGHLVDANHSNKYDRKIKELLKDFKLCSLIQPKGKVLISTEQGTHY